jgi:hypothetical protein
MEVRMKKLFITNPDNVKANMTPRTIVTPGGVDARLIRTSGEERVYGFVFLSDDVSKRVHARRIR